MLDRSLPLWASAGLDESGAAHEALDFEGRPLADDETRVRVQARQLYCFSLAHALGWQTARARDIVHGLLRTLTGVCRRRDGLYGRRVDIRRQALTDDTPDLYDNAFALLALATARGVLGGNALDQHIEQLLAALDTHMARRTAGGYAEFWPAPGYRLQNPHMHLFESLLALFAATRNTALRARIGALGSFIEGSFFNDEEACINEYADAAEAAQSGWFEPGHSMEWVWLLGWRSRLLGEPYPEFGRRVYRRALQTLDHAGRAVMSVTFAGDARDPSRRLWSQTETLKAHLCMMEQSRGAMADEAAARAARCAAGILAEWLEPAVAGGWLDHFGADGRLIAGNMPASSGYHLYCAIAELGRLA